MDANTFQKLDGPMVRSQQPFVKSQTIPDGRKWILDQESCRDSVRGNVYPIYHIKSMDKKDKPIAFALIQEDMRLAVKFVIRQPLGFNPHKLDEEVKIKFEGRAYEEMAGQYKIEIKSFILDPKHSTSETEAYTDVDEQVEQPQTKTSSRIDTGNSLLLKVLGKGVDKYFPEGKDAKARERAMKMAISVYSQVEKLLKENCRAKNGRWQSAFLKEFLESK